MKLNKVNEYLANLQPITEENIINGPEAIKNIAISNLIDIGRLHKIEDELITVLGKDIKKLSRKEAQYLLRDIDAVSARKENSTLDLFKEVNKNEFANKVFNTLSGKTETVISESGEIVESSIPEDTRVHLSNLLVDLLNDRTRS